MMAPETVEPITPPDTLLYPIDFFTRAAYDVQSGRRHLIEIATAARNGMDDAQHLFSGLTTLYGNPNGTDMSEAAVMDALPYFVNSLIGPSADPVDPDRTGWEIVNALTTDKPEHTRRGQYHSESYWELQTLQPGIRIGLKVVRDDSGEMNRTWYLTDTPVGERTSGLTRLVHRFGTIFRRPQPAVHS